MLRTTLMDYVATAREEGRSVEWFRQADVEENEQTFPDPAPHPHEKQTGSMEGGDCGEGAGRFVDPSSGEDGMPN